MLSHDPAFPYTEKQSDGSHWHSHPGMSQRDWFAGQALAGLLASGTYSNSGVGFEAFIAIRAGNIADAMMKNRLTAP